MRCGRLNFENRSCEAPDRRGVNSFGSIDDDPHVTKVEPGHVVIRRALDRQFEREVRRRRKRTTAAGQQLHPPGRFLHERHRTHQHCRPSGKQGHEHPEYQAHVVIEGQPRHHRGVRRRKIALVLEEVGH